MSLTALIPAGASAATSLLGHITRRGGGRPPEPQQVSTQPLTNRMDEIRSGGTAQFDSMLNAASAGAGFQGMANNRMANAQGMPGAFTARNQQMGAQARGQAFQGYVSGRQARDQMLNQLTGQKMQVNQQNVAQQNQHAMQDWMVQRQDRDALWQGLGGAVAQGAGDFHAHRQHQAQQGVMEEYGGMLQELINNQRNQQDWNAPSQSYYEQQLPPGFHRSF